MIKYSITLLYLVYFISIISAQSNSRGYMLLISSPINGVYITPNSPGSKIPSHGTSGFGEEYAIDFVMIRENDLLKKPYRKSLFEYLIKGINLSDFYGYGQTVYSPISGVVIAMENNVDERDPVNILKDIENTRRVTDEFINHNGSSTLITGNYVMIMISQNEYLLLAHLKKGSIKVNIGQQVNDHDVIGQLGHSGNSTMPHLHMQFMDHRDYRIAIGIPFVFKNYEIKKNGKWYTITNSVPKENEIVRF